MIFIGVESEKMVCCVVVTLLYKFHLTPHHQFAREILRRWVFFVFAILSENCEREKKGV